MIGLDEKTIERLSRPIIKVLKGRRDKNLRRELWVKCYTIKLFQNREELIEKLKKFGNVNIVDWDYLTLYEIKGVDSFDLEALLGLLRKNLTLN
jgi:hypothetical protein